MRETKGGEWPEEAIDLKQIIKKLTEAEVLPSQGSTVGGAERKIEAAEQTSYGWRREYGGTRIGKVTKSEELEFTCLFLVRICGVMPQSNT